jgi:hypothetical protein
MRKGNSSSHIPHHIIIEDWKVSKMNPICSKEWTPPKRKIL